jgi:hypothetical protein
MQTCWVPQKGHTPQGLKLYTLLLFSSIDIRLSADLSLLERPLDIADEVGQSAHNPPALHPAQPVSKAALHLRAPTGSPRVRSSLIDHRPRHAPG